MKKKICLLILLANSLVAADLNDFLNALGKVESGNNVKAFNKKENALGIFQIRELYFKDSRIKGTHNDCYNPVFSRKVVLAYFKRYEPVALKRGEWETLARCHNGGSSWRKKTGQAKKNLDIYWNKVKKEL